MKTAEQIQEKLDELAYFCYCYSQGGDDYRETIVRVKLDTLNWLLGTNHYPGRELYNRGEKLYRSGIRLK